MARRDCRGTAVFRPHRLVSRRHPAECVAVEAANLAPLSGRRRLHGGREPANLGLTAWQGLFEHGRLQAGQSALAHGASGAVGSMVTQLHVSSVRTSSALDAAPTVRWRSTSAPRVSSTSDNDALEDVGGVDLVFDVIGGDIQKAVRRSGSSPRNAGDHRRAAEAQPADGLAIDFVVESESAQLIEIVRRVRHGRLRRTSATVATSTMRCGPQPDRATQGEGRSSAFVIGTRRQQRPPLT